MKTKEELLSNIASKALAMLHVSESKFDVEVCLQEGQSTLKIVFPKGVFPNRERWEYLHIDLERRQWVISIALNEALHKTIIFNKRPRNNN